MFAKSVLTRPMTILVRIGRAATLLAFGLLALGLVCAAADLRVNTTRSIPVGLYRTTDAPLEKGKYLIFCPPQSELFEEAKAREYIGAGFCPGGYGFMMKRVVAMGGDRVSVAEEGVRVNGKLLPKSAPLESDKTGRVMPCYSLSDYTLGKSELLLMGDASGTSFDGRYFGPVEVSHIRDVIRPLITF
jgi:conjugative transfer signal peptidase TraF